MAIIKNWEKKKDSTRESVWINKISNLRVVVAKGNQSYQAWFEKNIGRVASDDSYIMNAHITGMVDRQTATKMAVNWMKKHTK